MKFLELQEYRRDLKSLAKRFRSLNDDIEIVKSVLASDPEERPPFSYRINGLNIQTCVIKVKKIACRSLRGRGVNTGLRLVYAYFSEDTKIVMVELYYKGDKENEDRDRILANFE